MRKFLMGFLGYLCKDAFAETITPEDALKALGIDPTILSKPIPTGEVTPMGGEEKQPPIVVSSPVATPVSEQPVLNTPNVVIPSTPKTAEKILKEAIVNSDEEPELETSEEEEAVDESETENDSEKKVDFSKISKDLLNEISKREREKLYGKMSRMEKKVSTLEAEKQELEGTVDTLRKQVKTPETEAYKQLLEQFSALAVTAANQKKRIESFQEVDEDALREEYEKAFAVREYRLEKLMNAQGRVIPELVMGNTVEEVDASFEAAVARYEEIVGKSGDGREKTSQAQPKAGTGAKSVRPSTSGAAPRVTQDTQLTPEVVRNMTPDQIGGLMKQLGVGKDIF